MKRKFVGAAIFLMLLLILTTGLTTNAHAATAPTPTPDFYALQKTCAVINVYLHGTQNPTTVCAQAKAAAGVSPYTPQPKPCSTSGVNMVIQYNNATQDVCIVGTGYLGYRVNAVTGVYSPEYGNTGTGVNGWFLWYYRGYASGSYCNIDGNNYWGASFVGRSIVDITQIDIAALHSNPVAC